MPATVRFLAPMKTSYSFSRRGPDHVALEIATVLLVKRWFEFKELFEVVHRKLKVRKMGGGEEMLRLRTYEKLQDLVSSGTVEKISKRYRGLATGLASFFEGAALVQAGLEEAAERRITVAALAMAN